MRTRPPVLVVAATAVAALALPSCDEETPAPAAPSIAVTCSATPGSGPAPLAVAFSVSVTGTPSFRLELQYGDGTAGSDPAAGHVYANPGSYGFRAIATGAGGGATCSQTITVTTPPTAVNRAPIAVIATRPRPAEGTRPLDVTINMCDSVDPDGDDLFFSYTWGNGAFHDGGRCARSQTYQKKGFYKATGCVTDTLPGHETCQTFNVLVR